MNIAEILQALFLGFLQGATEFIPVSSSGHLEIFPSLLGWNKPDTTLILFAHLGTLLALIIYFRHDLWEYIKSVLYLLTAGKEDLPKVVEKNLSIVKLIVIAVIPAGILGYLAKDYVTLFYDSGEYSLVSQALTLSAMAFLGVVFIVSDDWFTQKKTDLPKLPWWKAAIIGVAQMLAVVRGVSRSGISLLIGQSVSLNRVEAAKFSFLISIPIVSAASLLGVLDLLELSQAEFQQTLPAAIAIMLGAFSSGIIAIKYLLNYLSNNGLAAFGWYRIIFAGVAALLLFA